MTVAELTGESKKLRTEITKIRLEKFSGKDRNVRKGANKRKKLAQMLTKISEKQLELASKK